MFAYSIIGMLSPEGRPIIDCEFVNPVDPTLRVKAKALLDTGADTGSISPAIVDALGLESIGSVQVHGGNSYFITNQFRVDMLLPCIAEPFMITNCKVNETRMSAEQNGQDVLIGMASFLTGQSLTIFSDRSFHWRLK